MQTRDYDDYIYVESSLGFRKISKEKLSILTDEETNGYCNLYSDGTSVSYLNSMSSEEINAIHYFEDNENQIFETLMTHLLKTYSNPKTVLGFRYVNILGKHKDTFCFTEYVFIDINGKKVSVKMHKNSIFKD